MPYYYDFMCGRFALAVKNSETNLPVYKARFVVQGHTDREKDILVHSASTVRHHLVRVLVAIATILGLGYGHRMCLNPMYRRSKISVQRLRPLSLLVPTTPLSDPQVSQTIIWPYGCQ